MAGGEERIGCPGIESLGNDNESEKKEPRLKRYRFQ